MIACGSSGAISPGNAAANETTSRISTPVIALRLRMTARRKRPRSGLASSRLAASVTATSKAEPVGCISRLARSRIEHGRDDVGEQDADQNGKRVEQEEPLHQRQIVIGAGRVEEIAESWVGDQVLDHDRPAQH